MSNKKQAHTQQLEIIEDEEQEQILVTREFLSLQRNALKQLQSVLKMRLRTELAAPLSDRSRIIEEVDSKIEKIGDFLHRFEQLFARQNSLQSQYKELRQKGAKYDSLAARVNEIENAYKAKNQDLVTQNKLLEEELEQTKFLLREQQDKAIQLQGQTAELSARLERQDSTLKLQEAEINRLKIEKDSIKRQSSNLNSLLKQVNEEKDFNSDKIGQQLNGKLSILKDELDRVRENYSQKVQEKDIKIEKLERELMLLKKEVELNQEFTFLQSSLSLSKQSVTQSASLSSAKALNLSANRTPEKLQNNKISPIKKV